MDMGTLLHCNTVVLGMIVIQSLVGETQKSLLCLLLLIGYHFDDRNIFPISMAADHRFPLDELITVKKPVEENKDAGETEDTDSDDDDGDAGEEDDGDGDGDDGSDYEGEDSDDDADAEANDDSDSESDEDDDDNEDDDNDDDDDDDDNEDDDDEEEHKGPPYKRKK